MSTGTNTSSAVQAGAPTTLRRSRSMTAASNGSGKMVRHGYLWPALPSVLLVPLFVLGLPRRRLAGLATHILFRMLAFVFRLRIVGSLPFLQQSRAAGFDSPRLRNPPEGASPLWPAAEHLSNTCSPLTMGLSPIDAAVHVLDHAWDARVTERLSPWAGIPGFGVVLLLSGQLPRVGPLIQQHRRSHEADGALLRAGGLRYWGLFCPSP